MYIKKSFIKLIKSIPSLSNEDLFDFYNSAYAEVLNEQYAVSYSDEEYAKELGREILKRLNK